MRFPVLTAFVLIFAVLSAPASAMPGRDMLAAHKALYDIEMISKRSGSQIVNISGQMYYEWKPGCEAWTTDHRFNLNYEYADSPAVRITSDFSTYETFDGKSFDFTSRRKRNGDVYEEVRGRAETIADGGGDASYTMPAGLKFKLEKNTLFPLAHSLGILEHARKGDRFYHAVVFDGSDDEGPVEVNTFIGEKIDGTVYATNPKIDTSLLESPAWKVRMAFFPMSGNETGAEYEMDVVLHENGIISDMMVEYHDFAVTQKLSALEKVPVTADCGKDGG